MPAMIQPCPACGKKGIMKKSTGICARCSNNSTPAQIVKEPPKPAAAEAVDRSRREQTVAKAEEHRRARDRGARCVGGRFVR